MLAFFDTYDDNRKIFYTRKESPKIVQVVGLVRGLPSFAGRKIKGATEVVYMVDIPLEGWRIKGEELEEEFFKRVKKNFKDPRKMLEFLEVFSPHSIVEFEARHVRTFGDVPVFRVNKVTNRNPVNRELEEMRRTLKPLESIVDEELGITYWEGAHHFEATVQWMGRPIKICVSDTDRMEKVRGLIKDQERWNKLIIEFALEKLFGLKNRSWLEKQEKPLTPQEFISRITLNAIECYSDSFTCWFDDGEIFWGHAIAVSGDIETGRLMDASMGYWSISHRPFPTSAMDKFCISRGSC